MPRSFVLLITCCVLHAAPVLAADDPQNEAQRLFETGLQLSIDERWTEAHAAFLSSAQLVPRASTYFNLAVSSLELGLGRAALDALELFEALADPVKQGDYMKRVAELRVQAHARIGTLELSIAPADARLEIDGAYERARGTMRVLLLDPGLHVVRVSADGHAPRSLELTLNARSTLHQRIELQPLVEIGATPAELQPPSSAVPTAQTVITPQPPMPDQARPAESIWAKPLTWIVIGAVVVAGVIVTTVAVTDDDGMKRYGGSSGITL